jgi:hypothetical protein
VTRVFRLFSLALLLGAAGLWSAASPPLVPRLPAAKSAYPPLPPETPVAHIVLKLHEGTNVRLRDRALAAQPRNLRGIERLASLGLSGKQVAADLDAVRALLASSRHARGLERLFSAGEAELAALRSEGEARSGRELADLDLYYRVPLSAGVTQVEVESLVESLNAFASVEVAYAEPPASAAVDIPPVTPSFESSQGYLDPAPSGIDARYAWTVAGGRGQGVKIVDVEGAWRTSHEDLPALFYQGGTQYNILSWRNHGTAVLGELVAPANGYGVTGIANLAQAGVESIAAQSTPSAIANAAVAAGTGGVVLIELHSQGPATPNSPCNCSNNCDFVPMEYFQANYDAIALATANGTVVVEAGGNGATDLDDPVYAGKFDRLQRDSGAILVGASNSFDRAPTCFTNFGGRIDVHGWGWDVTTLGYGDLFNPTGNEDQFYTSSFSGTSSASPIVTGAVADLQGVSLAAGKGNASPAALRQLLRDTGTPQSADARQIGPLPNLQAAINQLLAPPRAAQFLSQSVPSTLSAGRVYPISLTVKNTGTLAWSPIGPQCNAFRLGSANPYNNATWLPAARVDLPNVVPPGGQVTLNFNVTAPSTPGTYNFQWQMVQECVTWFGDFSPNVVITVQAAPARDAQVLAQSVLSTMSAGRVYPVSLTVKNTGSQAWSPIGPSCGAFRLGSANPYNNATWLPATRVELPNAVPPGGVVTLSFNVAAPLTPGTYNFQWQMVQECVTWFGDFSPNVAVTVQPAPLRDAQILAQSVPPSMTAGQSYPVSIRVRNVGTLTWNPIGPQCNAFRLGSANPYNNGTWLPATRVELPATLAPGGEVSLNFTVTAPSTPATYNFQWQMVQECVTWFGDFSPNLAIPVSP